MSNLVPINDENATALAVPSTESLVNHIRSLIKEDMTYIHKQSGKRLLKAPAIFELANQIGGFDFSELTTEREDGYWYITVKVTHILLGSKYGSATQAIKPNGKMDDKALEKGETRAQRRALEKMLPRHVIQATLAALYGDTPPPAPPPEQAQENPTTNKKAAFAASKDIVERLMTLGFKPMALWDMYKAKYKVESRNELDPNGKEWAEIAAQLNTAKHDTAMFDKLVGDIATFLKKDEPTPPATTEQPKVDKAAIAKNHYTNNKERLYKFLGDIPTDLFWKGVADFFGVESFDKMIDEKWDLLIEALAADDYSKIGWFKQLRDSLKFAADKEGKES